MTILALDGAELDPTIHFDLQTHGRETWVRKGTLLNNPDGYSYTAMTALGGSPHGTLLVTARRVNNMILRSTDGGATWAERLSQTASWGNQILYCGSQGSTNLYWMIGTYGNNYAAYYHSSNDGTTWYSRQADSSSSRIFGYAMSDGKGRVWAGIQNGALQKYHTAWGSSNTWTNTSTNLGVNPSCMAYDPIYDEWIWAAGSNVYYGIGTATSIHTNSTWNAGTVMDIKSFQGYTYVINNSGQIYRQPKPINAGNPWNQVYNIGSIGYYGRTFHADNQGRLWAFNPTGKIVYTYDGVNWVEVPHLMSNASAFLAQHIDSVVMCVPTIDEYAFYRWEVPTDASTLPDTITVQPRKARTGDYGYQVNAGAHESMLVRDAGTEAVQRVGFGFQYPAAAPTGEIPIAAFGRVIPGAGLREARPFNTNLFWGGGQATSYIGYATLTASGSNSPSFPIRAMDGSNISGIYWQSNTTSPAWLQLNLANFPKQRLAKYVLCSASTVNQSPMTWTVEGYIDGSWVTLDSRTDEAIWTANERREYILPAIAPLCNNFRIVITHRHGGTVVSLNEWQLWGVSETTSFSDTDYATVGLYLDVATKTLRVRGEDGALWAETTTLFEPDLWHYLEFSHNPTVGGQVRFNGEPVATWNEGTDGIDKVLLGAFSPTTATYFLDDIVISEGADAPGPVKVHFLAPDADGAHTDWIAEPTGVIPSMESMKSKFWGWYEADNTDGEENATRTLGGTIPNLTDLSGKNHHFITASGAPTLATNQLGDKPALVFSASQGLWQSFTAENVSSELLVYAIYRHRNTSSSQCIYNFGSHHTHHMHGNTDEIGIQGNSGYNVARLSFPKNEWGAARIYTDLHNAGNASIRLLNYGTETISWVHAGVTNLKSVGFFSLGGYSTNGSSWSGRSNFDLALLIIAQEMLTAEEEAVLLTYMQEKYMPGLTKPYPGGKELTRSDVLRDGFDHSYVRAMQGTTSFSFDNVVADRQVLAVQVLSRLSKDDVGTGATEIFLRQDGEDTVIDTIEPTLTPTWYVQTLEKQPDNAPWTWTTINGLEAGWMVAMLPDPPAALSAANGSTPADIEVSYAYPISDGGSPVIDYEVELTTPDPPQVDILNATSTSVLFLARAFDVTYSLRVRCRTLKGWSGWSAPISYTHLSP